MKERFPVVKDLGKRSDYYIYFYFHGLSLLNINGTFCFITSNSWLDVEYGKGLQEFLCKYVPITAIYDNPKRSFTHADVNTIIALFGAPEAKQRSLGDWLSGMNGGNERIWPNIKSVAKFVMFKKPFEEVLSSQNLVNIENVKVKVKGEGITELVKNVVSTNDYRVFLRYKKTCWKMVGNIRMVTRMVDLSPAVTKGINGVVSFLRRQTSTTRFWKRERTKFAT